jgi:uncharacterized membrane protein
VLEGSPLCTIWPAPTDPDAADEHVRDVVVVGTSRTVQQDPAYGLRQLVDVALIALSPGVNDPTTAQDAMLHASALLRRLIAAPQQRARRDRSGRTLLMPHIPGPAELVALTFAQVRHAAAPLPEACVQLLECLHGLCRALEPEPCDPAALAAIAEQARLIVAGAAAQDLLPEDLARVRRAYARHFDTAPTVAGGGDRG